MPAEAGSALLDVTNAGEVAGPGRHGGGRDPRHRRLRGGPWLANVARASPDAISAYCEACVRGAVSGGRGPQNGPEPSLFARQIGDESQWPKPSLLP
jgi:hypothetical protein